MAFTVNFYQFNKEDNSTARPSRSPESFQCTIKHGSGLISPTIELDIGLTTAPIWNYCYIPNFNRFYYVSEWYFDKAIWTATLTCDVLATYRTEIGNAHLYALRTSVPSLYDGRIPDTLYPTKVNSTFNSNTISNPWSSPLDGCFVIGVNVKKPIYGSLSYFVVDRDAMQSLVEGLIDDTIKPENGFNLTDASEGLQLALVDPLQYIKSAIFIPIPFEDIPAIAVPLDVIPVFNYPVLTDGEVAMIVDDTYITITKTIPISKHPQTSSRGNWVNTSPYTTATLIFPPFGTIELDTTVLCDVSSIDVEIRLDVINGLGIMEVKAHGIVLNRLESQIGVPMQLSQVTRDYMGAMNNVVSSASSIASGIGNIASGSVSGIASGIGNLISGAGAIGNAMASLVPRSQSIGSGGNFAQLYESPRVDMQFFEVVDDDIAKNGRPCCKVVQCGNASGYYLIQDGDVLIHGTKEEAKEIRSYLETGFFWE